MGKIPEEEKEKILREREEVFNDQIFEDLKTKEREKTPEELHIISLANNATNEVRQKYGLDDFEVPPKNIHIIKEEEWPKEEKGGAHYISMLQGIAIRECSSRTVFMKKALHEMVHFKSYNAMQVTTGENPKLDQYRVGLSVFTRDGKILNFTNLNEAVTEEVAKRLMATQITSPILAEEAEQTKNVMARYPNEVTQSDEPLYNNDTYYVETLDNEEKNPRISTERFGYFAQRKMLDTLIDKLFERNPGEFKDREEVFEVFAKGMMTGNILPVGKLIEGTFGNGTLRKIGELDKDVKAQEEFVNAL